MESGVNNTVFCKYEEPMESEVCVIYIKEEPIHSEQDECNSQINLINHECIQSSSNNFQIKNKIKHTEEVECVSGVENLEIKEEPLDYTFYEDDYLNNQSDQVQCVTNKILKNSKYDENTGYKKEDMFNEGTERKCVEKIECIIEDRKLNRNNINDLNKTSEVSNHTTMTGKLEMSYDIDEKNVNNNKILYNVVELKSGEKIHLNKSDRSEICDERFESGEILSTPMLENTNEKSTKCVICEKVFRFRSNFSRHMRTHTGEKPFKCDICGKHFSEKRNLQYHSKIHTGEKSYKCDFCGNCFSRKDFLNIHIRTHTGEKPFECNICSNRFSEKSSLKVHMRIHLDEIPFKCAICGKRFRQKINLNVHMRTHTNERPFKCDECGKCFRQKINLNVHNRTHTGERPFKCVICGNGFSLQAALTRHIRTHTGERPFKCDFCGRHFSEKSSLKIHIRTHTGEKCCKCDICGKCFSRKSTLNIHIRIHTGEKHVKNALKQNNYPRISSQIRGGESEPGFESRGVEAFLSQESECEVRKTFDTQLFHSVFIKDEI